MEENVAYAKKELSEVEIRASKVEKEFWKQECANALSKNIVCLTIKLDEVGSSLALMCKRMTDARHKEAQAILNTKVEIAKLEKNFQAKIENLKVKANN